MKSKKKIKVRPKVKGPEVSDPAVLDKLDKDRLRVQLQLKQVKTRRFMGYSDYGVEESLMAIRGLQRKVFSLMQSRKAAEVAEVELTKPEEVSNE